MISVFPTDYSYNDVDSVKPYMHVRLFYLKRWGTVKLCALHEQNASILTIITQSTDFLNELKYIIVESIFYVEIRGGWYSRFRNCEGDIGNISINIHH